LGAGAVASSDAILPSSFQPRCAETKFLEEVVEILLIVLVVFFLFGGGGYYGYRRWR
jgi:hypothetical protein